ncbi:GAF domain-containing protein or Signal transduction response regulator [Streptomyces venezuelae ATCC 10712]|uniref:GAF domain-containing protein or Signal transduction response regulator n=1 Tax=Streptomyces venezuelae (strain ATCC 10712 / CBS 650.69 / DSM 40230 / JCM 4526 / NBRC 13096 / PD 04745) TaxID=953739 RepID=F2RIW1_STRVP|nr:hypothetical protein vnz_33535 [Streptomyces venezuelae]CCA60087.1 GAF domain-containing protein or Signal transduction response regulator [Streptomyces venezuelae ATCC 10712]
MELDGSELAAYRDGHPLAAAMPVIRELMGAYTTDGEHLLAVCDAAGRMMRVEGHRATLRKARTMNFAAGARWSKTAAGTNAPGTALTWGFARQAPLSRSPRSAPAGAGARRNRNRSRGCGLRRRSGRRWRGGAF